MQKQEPTGSVPPKPFPVLPASNESRYAYLNGNGTRYADTNNVPVALEDREITVTKILVHPIKVRPAHH